MNYDKFINKRVAEIPPSGIRKFFDIVSDMPDAISLGVGEPDFVTPWEIRDSAIKSLQKGYTSYTSNKGLTALREEISGYLKSRFNVSFCADKEILVTVGASEAIDLALRTIVEEGDEVLVPDPSYVSYCPNVTIVGGVAVPVKTDMEHCFKLMPEMIEKAITKKSKAIILPYPNNPTGAVMSRDELAAIIPVILKHDLIVISDEIYAELSYFDTHTSMASFKEMQDRTIVINGFSKAFAMTGWRLGYVAAREPFLKQMLKIHQYTMLCAPIMSQYAGLAALNTGKADGYKVVGEMRDKYNMRRRYMVDRLNRMGLSCFDPGGAFYVFPSVKSTGLSGEDFANSLIVNAKVAVVPGSAFGESGKDHVRCCYACSMAAITEACDRMERFIQGLKK